MGIGSLSDHVPFRQEITDCIPHHNKDGKQPEKFMFVSSSERDCQKCKQQPEKDGIPLLVEKKFDYESMIRDAINNVEVKIITSESQVDDLL